MIKKELEKLRTLNATKAMLQALQMPGEEKNWYSKKPNKFKYHLAARCQNLNGYLKISICTREDIDKGIHTPKWDVFINYEGDEYITRERQKDGTYKWREAYIFNLEDERYYWSSQRDYDVYMYMNAEGKSSVQMLLKTKKKGYEGICEWQQGCKKRREDAKVEKQVAIWNKQMLPIKELPKGFEEWWHHNGFDGAHFLYYKSANAREGYCTSCLGTVKLTGKPEHTRETQCPVCGKRVTMVSRAKKKVPVWTRYYHVSCLQKYGDGLVQRDFSIRRIDSSDTIAVNRSKFIIEETYRTLILEDSYEVFEWGDYRRRGNVWMKSENQSISQTTDNIYPRNMKQVLKGVHTAYPIAVEHGCKPPIGLLFFLTRERKYPVIEMAYKAELYNLAYDMVRRSWVLDTILEPRQKGELAKQLLIDKARMKRLKQMDGDINCLIWLQHEKKLDTIMRDNDIMTLSNAELQPETIQRSEISKYLSIEKISNYLNKQAQLRKMQGKAIARIWRDWNDYVSMLRKMKMDLSKELLLKPKDLMIAHNELVARISMKNSKKEINQQKKKYKNAQGLMEQGELKKYEYANEKYCIVAPKGIEDIFEEGIVLKHCIHTCDIYFQRIDIRETYLLFLRRTEAPDRPWYTLEIEPGGNIRQKKSVLNEAYRDLEDALPFLKEWQQWIVKNLSKEDQELAKKSNKARKDGYKKLREEKKLIWHGRLQGTLLADALEDDFMEAII